MTLEELRLVAMKASVSFTVEYSEAEDLWYGQIDSLVPGESREFKHGNNAAELLESLAAWIAALGRR